MLMSSGSATVADACATAVRPRLGRASGCSARGRSQSAGNIVDGSCLPSRKVSRGRASSDSFHGESSSRSILESQPTLKTIKSESLGPFQDDGSDDLPNDMGHQASIGCDVPSPCTSCSSMSHTLSSAHVQDVDNMNNESWIDNKGCMSNVGNVIKTFIPGSEGALDVMRQDKNESAARITELEKDNVKLKNDLTSQKNDFEQKMTKQRERFEKEKHEREMKQKESEQQHELEMAKMRLQEREMEKAIAISRDETKKEEVTMSMRLQESSNEAELEKLKLSNKAIESNMLKQAEIDGKKLEQERQAEKELNEVRRAHEEEMQRRQHAHEARLSLVAMLREFGASIAGVLESFITCGPDREKHLRSEP